MNIDPTQCTAVTTVTVRNQENRLVRAGNQCERDKQHDGPHGTREMYDRGDDPKRPDGITFAPYEWDDPTTPDSHGH